MIRWWLFKGVTHLKFEIAKNSYNLYTKLFTSRSTIIVISLIILTLITPLVEGGSSWYQTDWSNPSSYKFKDNLDTNTTPGDITLGGFWGWVPKMDLPQARDNLGAASLGGKIYALGGWNHNIPGQGIKLVTEYNPITNAWTPKTQLTVGRQHVGVVSANNSIFAIGGYYNLNVFDTVEVYNVSSDTWTTKTAMITQRQMFGIANTKNEIYIIGGRTDTPWNTQSKIVEAYNISSDSWTTKAPLSIDIEGLGAAAVNGLIYAIGGLTGVNTILKTVRVYNPANNTWWNETDMNKGRANFGISVYNNEIYVIGGYNNGYLDSVEKYMP
jgi:N-acetylneuraminic acid mutarotase